MPVAAQVSPLSISRPADPSQPALSDAESIADGLLDDAASRRAESSAWHAMEMDFVIEAPLADVWDFFTNTSLNFIARSATIRSHAAICPNGRSYDPDTTWPALQAGLVIRNTLHWGFDQPLDMEITAVEPRRVVEMHYGKSAPAEGVQTILFDSMGGRTRIAHVSTYRGKNPLYTVLYPTVHHQVFDPFYAHAKYYLESVHWAAGVCALGSGAGRDDRFSRVLRLVRSSGPGFAVVTEYGLKKTLCEVPRLHMSAVRPVPIDDEDLARMIAPLALDASLDDARFRAALRREAEAEQAKRQETFDACR